MNDKVKALAEKIAAKEAAKKAILDKYEGKTLTDKQRIARIEELLGIAD